MGQQARLSVDLEAAPGHSVVLITELTTFSPHGISALVTVPASLVDNPTGFTLLALAWFDSALSLISTSPSKSYLDKSLIYTHPIHSLSVTQNHIWSTVFPVQQSQTPTTTEELKYFGCKGVFSQQPQTNNSSDIIPPSLLAPIRCSHLLYILFKLFHTVHRFLQAKMCSVPSISIYPSQRYPSPEGTPPLSPYHVSNNGYDNDMPGQQGIHYSYASQPGSPLFFTPDTPSSPQNIGWSSPGQGFESSTLQNIIYDQGSAQYNTFGVDCGQYQHSTYPHHLNVDSNMASPMMDFSSQTLHIPIGGFRMMDRRELDVMSSDQRKSPVAVQMEHEQYSYNESAPNSPFVLGYQSPWSNTAAYIPLSPLSQAASPSRSWAQPSAPMATPVESQARYRELSHSSCSIVNSPPVVFRPAFKSRRRQNKDKSLRKIKCDTPGCHQDFDRPYNAKVHREVVHGNPERNEKCPLSGCEKSIHGHGFQRKHDMIRHVICVCLFFSSNP